MSSVPVADKTTAVHLCPDCDLQLRAVRFRRGQRLRCPRCRHVLSQKVGLLSHCRALTITGFLLYIPANFQPVLLINMGGESSSNTVWSGVVGLWQEELFVVAVLVFVFAIAVPLLRLLALVFVLFSLEGRHYKGLLFMRLHHRLHGWGMMDIFLLGTLVAVIKLQDYAEVEAGAGVFCLAAMMLVEIRASQLLPRQMLWRAFGRVG